jgi:uncharacterized integral membrane protein
VALVVFMLSNRNPVEISYWPLGPLAQLPVGVVVLVVLALGFVLGLAFHLPSRLAAGRRAKRAEKRNAELEARLSVPAGPPVSTGTPAP